MNTDADIENFTGDLGQKAREVSGGDLPAPLKAVTERHMEQIAQLVGKLRAAGLPEDLIRHSVRELVSSYEKELVEAALEMKKGVEHV